MNTESLLELVLTSLQIIDDYSVWQHPYQTITIEQCESFNKGGVACICAGDEKSIMYMRDK